MQRKKLLFLTNPENDAPEEDACLIAELKGYFEVEVAHPRSCITKVPSIDGVVIRNIWPTHEYLAIWHRAKETLIASGIPIYNSLAGKGDAAGKSYLVDLYKSSFPVIPSVSSARDLDRLPSSEYFWIKPDEGCDGFGAEKLTRQELLSKQPVNYIIQPYYEFEYEPSFYFIDDKFSYAVSKKNRLSGERAVAYQPTPDDLDFATKFVQWNQLSRGIQRIDAIHTRDNKLLLTEVEDLCPYLYLLTLNDDIRKAVVSNMLRSISKLADTPKLATRL
jgi:hypothetical protein